MSLTWVDEPLRAPDSGAEAAAEQRQDELTKPPGALGRLEALAVQLAGLQGRERPRIENVRICVFAGDHGVAARGVSAFPAEVTTEMVRNFARGGAAISVLARHHGADLMVVNLGTLGDTSGMGGVTNLQLGPATADFTISAAMTHDQLAASLRSGRDAVRQADLFIGGEMGIGNTTAATAIAAVLLGQPAAELVGPGTGLKREGVQRKTEIIEQGLRLHSPAADRPLEVLRCLGGFEIAALTGALLRCGQLGVPVLVDGFISAVAALVATRIKPDLKPWLIHAHRSAEPGHRAVLAALEAEPLLDLGMRLGEGSGAAVALPLLQQACVLHDQMATFAEAAVSEQNRQDADDLAPGTAGVPPAKPPKGWYSRNYLPHCDTPGLIQAITFRLGDALPKRLLQRLQEETDDAIKRAHFEQLLDAGHGRCWLARHDCAEVVEQALFHGDGERYRLLAWCIMPNHVHVLIEPHQRENLGRIIHSWKSFSAKKINKILARTGPLWQREYHDRYIRDDAHLAAVVRYIEHNPVKAGLVTSAESWRFGSGWSRQDAGGPRDKGAPAPGTAGVPPATRLEE